MSLSFWAWCLGFLLRLGLIELFNPLPKLTYSPVLPSIFPSDISEFFVFLVQLFRVPFVPNYKLLSLVYKDSFLLLRQGLSLVASDQLRLLGVCLS